ncbi:hypothetical protein I7I50_00406 [Histoplasma capsulatum G186AR]|uniref:Extracellular membrane protein CFEM domain-containing protein n=1 Tax=Ajellomyces capsulatus TaxID=5037 RepID=A0A8H7YIZ7_AJECA|nr:hypothetical protein I7I52_07674 [Histoplasma capsulatum]QSS72538.1 hypothetical protein I7I50_00406 [Histoplasma capsulatum G186AR]
MQFINKAMALVLLLAPLVLAAPTEDAPPAADFTSLGCRPGSYRCVCIRQSTDCWVDVCTSSGNWKLSSICRNRSSPSGRPTCKDGPNGTAYCI